MFGVSRILRNGRFVVLLLAVIALGSVLSIWRYWPDVYLRSARQALARRDYNAAHADLENYLRVRPESAEAHLLMARLDRRGNRLNQFALHLDACQRLGGFAEEVELERALLALQNGDFDPRLEALCRKHAVPSDPYEFFILEALSQGYCKVYHLPEAQFCLNRMLEIQPDNGYCLRRRAWIYANSRKYQEAEADYRRALEIDPNDRVARLGLAQLLLDVSQDGSKALEQFDRLLKDSREAATTLGYARSLLLLGRTDEGRLLLDDWLRDHPDDAPALTERGKLALEEKQLDAAESWLRHAVQLAPSDPRANHSLYLCLVRKGKAAEAEECQTRFNRNREDTKRLDDLMQELKRSPDDADLRCQAAEIFLRQHQEPEGERWLLTTLQMRPDHGPSHRALADFYRRKGRSDLAESHQRLAEFSSCPSPSKP
jgi:tetratricopeptide (TPR) repeat protein